MRDVILVDLDRCLADDSDRRNTLVRTKDVEGYYRSCGTDKLVAPVAALVRAMYGSDYSIYLLSSRPRIYEKDTADWLVAQEIKYWRLIMDIQAARLPLAASKYSIVIGLKIISRIEFVIDDDESSVRMWQSNSIPCFRPIRGINA